MVESDCLDFIGEFKGIKEGSRLPVSGALVEDVMVHDPPVKYMF